MKIILASKSPRRQEILQGLRIPFRVFTCEVDESLPDGILPSDAVRELAERKRAAAAALLHGEADFADSLIVSADTVVALDGKIYGKPHTPARAREMLHTFSGRCHQVWTGISLSVGDRQVSAAERTDVTFDTLTDEIIDRYLLVGDPYDKAGAYGIQGAASLLISGIQGDYFNVVGLPVHRMAVLAKEAFGLDLLSCVSAQG